MSLYKAYTKERGIVETDILNDNLLKLTWHREDGPAYIRYDENGNIEREGYYINDKKHRLDGPAAISYHNNGKLKFEEYWINGIQHKLDGPAIIYYNEVGHIILEEYWINGIGYTKDQYYKELLKLKVQSL